MHNNRGQVVIDRRFNTSQLVSLYLDKPVPEDVITWNPDNPNQLRMALPGRVHAPITNVVGHPSAGDTVCACSLACFKAYKPAR